MKLTNSVSHTLMSIHWINNNVSLMDISFFNSLKSAIYRNLKKEDFLEQMKLFLNKKNDLTDETKQQILKKLANLV